MTHAFSISHHPHLSPSHTQTHTTDRAKTKRFDGRGHTGTDRFGRGCHGLHLLMGHPYIAWRLQDGGGAEPKRQSSSSRVGSRGPVGGASSVKEEEQHHCKPIVLYHHSQIMNWPPDPPAGGQRAKGRGQKSQTQYDTVTYRNTQLPCTTRKTQLISTETPTDT